MTALQKTFLAFVLTAAIGAGGYQAHQALRLRERAQALQRELVRLSDQCQELQYEHKAATNRLAALLLETQQLKSNAEAAEIGRLRTEVARLQAAKVQGSESNSPALDTWLDQVNRLKQLVEQHPDQTIPEFKFLTEREWLIVAACDDLMSDSNTAIENLKGPAIARFAEVVEQALKKYAEANRGGFPRALSQLEPFCDNEVADILRQRYEIKPASILPKDLPNHQDIKTDWVIAGKDPTASNTGNHIAIYAAGYTYFW
jgi:hypothetical protein